MADGDGSEARDRLRRGLLGLLIGLVLASGALIAAARDDAHRAEGNGSSTLPSSTTPSTTTTTGGSDPSSTPVTGPSASSSLSSLTSLAAVTTSLNTTLPEPTVVSHTWTAAYSGVVWVTVDAPEDHARSIVIRWGPYQRKVFQAKAGPVTYAFKKLANKPGDPAIPTTVTVSPGAIVTFGEGTSAPAGAVDVNDGWVPA